MLGISVADGAFVLTCREWLGQRRHFDDNTTAILEEFGERYAELLSARSPAEGLQALGRDLYRFLDGDAGELATLLDRAPRPIHFEIATPTRRPDRATRALLRAPWELLANNEGYLAGDDRLGFSPMRRLGRAEAPPPLDQYRLGLVFMAASPHGVVDLDYEAEEAAIIGAVGSTDLDLFVEESGNPEELGDRLVELPRMQALQLSCHGHNAWPIAGKPEPRPVLMLEDETGEALPTEAGDLIRALRGRPPRLVFLSACLTAVGDQGEASSVLAQSLVESMVDGGFPAVLGWDGSVADRAASAFAVHLYDSLAGRRDLADAVAGARQTLLNHTDNILRDNWHLARLWLGPDGGGPLVGGARRRDLVPTHGEKEFLIKERRKLPVASHQMFVGRRHELQTVLRALREGGHAGVLLHGMGRLGKSSLAARIANRRPDLKLAVVFEHYAAPDILAAIKDALQENREARELLRQAIQLVSNEPDRFEESVIDLVCASCMQAGNGGTPLLLLIDDLERILDADPGGGPHRIKPTFAPVIQAILRAFDRTTDCRLILTSRFPFVLNGLEERLLAVQLPPLSEAAKRKLQLRQIEAAADNVLAGSEAEQRAELVRRVPAIARGNPGLQDLIGRRIVLSNSVTLEHAERTLREMESWLAGGELPADAGVRQFLVNLAIDALIELGADAGKRLLRHLNLFDLPVPETVADRVAELISGSVQHLRDLGLVDALEDLVDHRKVAIAVNALAAGRLEPLSEQEGQSLVRSIAQPLFLAWGGVAGAGERPLSCELQLTLLGLAAGDADIVETCAEYAVLGLDHVSAKERSALGQAAITLLDTQGRTPPLRLLSETAEATSSAGEGEAADALLARGVALVAQLHAASLAVDPMPAAFVLYAQANRFMTRGDLEQAERLFKQAAELAAAAGNEINAVIARGRVADILERRGDLDEALRIRREEQLPVYERLGDVRSRALTMGHIADILYSRGDLDEALRIRREEELPVYERLGDVRSCAVTMGQIADILESRGDLDEALRIRREEQLPVYERLGDVRSRAVTMGKIADILQSRGDLDEVLRIRREEELPVYERLGDVRERAVSMSKVANILEQRGNLDEAHSLYNQVLDAMRSTGEAEGIANALYGLAHIEFSQKNIKDAAPRLIEAYRILLRTGRAQGIANVGIALGQVLVGAKMSAEGLKVLRRSVEMFRKIGQENEALEGEKLITDLGLTSSVEE